MKGRILSGIQPTGRFHIGNYLGSVHQWLALQDDYECLFCVVNLHAMTVPFVATELKHTTYSIAAAYIAAGIDPDRAAIFPQSAVAAHAELGWILGCMTPLGWLNRMTQFKDKAGKDKEKASLGLYGYPALMAADILAYKATHVPVGEDQKQHLELARDIAGAFNRFCGEDFFPLPKPLIQEHGSRIMSLKDGTKKMSKSDPAEGSRIELDDTDDQLAQKIRKAKTDADPFPLSFEAAEHRPEVRNLMTLYSVLSGDSFTDICQRFGGGNFSPFKEALLDIVVSHFGPVRDRYIRLMGDIPYLETVLNTGADKALTIATPILDQIFDRTGLMRRP